MFPDKSVFNKVVKKTQKDLRGFFDYNFNEFDYPLLLDDLRRIDALYFSNDFNGMGTLAFSEKLLNWLDDTRKARTVPWVSSGRSLKLPTTQKGLKRLGAFLTHLEGWINRLLSTGAVRDKAQFSPIFLGLKWMEFRNYIIQKNLLKGKWKIVFNSASKQDKTYLGDFVSWLVLFGKSGGPRTLQIMYDAERISESTGEISIPMSRLRKVFLHELGHARTELPYYVECSRLTTGTAWIESIPLHEYEAWIYALIILSTLSSIRARVTRITKNGDLEWRAFI
jgi:hypothetical protein